MEISSIQEKKLNVIEQLIIINDEKVIKKVEDLINNSLKRPHLKKLTKAQLINRARLANKDIEDGNYILQNEVEKLSQKW